MGQRFKSACIQKMPQLTDNDMEAIRALALDINEDDIFTFKVAMCDNEIDRDFEKFSDEALDGLAELFIGKTVIKDHTHKSDNQVARIYATEVIENDDGSGYRQLVARCYMVKTQGNADLIAEIKAGIKKEVSVGVAVKSAVCSICGTDNAKRYCEHWNGREYDGNLCYFTLDGAVDAYELSFVAVPAQRAAGTIKDYTGEEIKEEPVKSMECEEDAAQEPQCNEELCAVEMRARLNEAFIFSKKMKNEKEELQ